MAAVIAQEICEQPNLLLSLCTPRHSAQCSLTRHFTEWHRYNFAIRRQSH